jgi:threonine aldolase
MPVDPDAVETNFVQLRVQELGLSSAEALRRLAAEGVGLSMTIHEGVLRAVTHLDVSDADIEQAIAKIPQALGTRVAA